IAWDGTPRVMAILRKLVDDPATPIRTAAVEALVETTDRGSLPVLRSRFADEKDPQVRRAIALGLGKMADRQALDSLIAALRDPRPPEPVRDAALEAVEAIDTDRAVKTLTELLVQMQDLGFEGRDPGAGREVSSMAGRAKGGIARPTQKPSPATN